MQEKDYGVFGDVLAAASIGSWKIEVDEGREPRMYADATMRRLIGIAEDVSLAPEEVYHAWYDRVDVAHRDAVAEGVGHMIDGEMAEIQYPWHHPDGRTIVVRCGGVRDRSYTAGARVAGIHQWVTTMKHVDRELERQQRELQESRDEAMKKNARMDVLQHLIKAGFWCYRVNAENEVVGSEYSGDFAEFLHVDPDFVDVGPEIWRTRVHPEDRDNAYAAFRATITDHSGRTPYDVIYRMLDRDGNYRWYHSSGGVIRHEDGTGEFFGIKVDVTKTVEKEHEQRRVMEEARALEKANKAKNYFFSMVSHDIRTPLNAIIGYAELLKLGIADEAERRKAVNSVLVSGRTLLELINDVLDLSKLEAGKMEILPEPVDVRQLVEEVTDAFRATLGGKPVEIRSKVEQMPLLNLDPHRVRQILFNLVGNAVKFTEKGYVEVRAEYRDGVFRFAVSDTGCGISEEDQKRVDQPYVQVGLQISRGKGTGLGLAICKQLVARMGGTLKLDSVVDRGSTFTITLPNVEEKGEASQTRFSMTQRISVAIADKPFSCGRVLIVDDVPMNRMVLKTMLRKLGVNEVEMADNGFNALTMLEESSAGSPFDLVLTDMWMPGMDGERLVREIRKRPEWAELPVYAVTADVETQKAYLGMGFTGILLKPLTFEKIQEFFKNLRTR